VELGIIVTIVELLCLRVCAGSTDLTLILLPPLAMVFKTPSVFTELDFEQLVSVLLVFDRETTLNSPLDGVFGFVKDEDAPKNVEDDGEEAARVDVAEEGIRVLLLFLVVLEELVVDGENEVRFELGFKFETVDRLSEITELFPLPALDFVLAFVLAFVFKLAAISVDCRSSFRCLLIGGLDMTLNEDGGSRCLISIGAILSVSFPFFSFFLSGSPYPSDSDSLVKPASSPP